MKYVQNVKFLCYLRVQLFLTGFSHEFDEKCKFAKPRSNANFARRYALSHNHYSNARRL